MGKKAGKFIWTRLGFYKGWMSAFDLFGDIIDLECVPPRRDSRPISVANSFAMVDKSMKQAIKQYERQVKK